MGWEANDITLLGGFDSIPKEVCDVRNNDDEELSNSEVNNQAECRS